MDEEYVLTDKDCLWIQLRREQLIADYAKAQGKEPENISEFKRFFFTSAAVEEFRDLQED